MIPQNFHFAIETLTQNTMVFDPSSAGFLMGPQNLSMGSRETLGLYSCVYALGRDQPKYVAPEIWNQNSGPPGQNFDS